jgi:Family of unknown function (DUF5677)
MAMPKGRRAKKSKRKANGRYNSSLAEHRRHKKTLTPPMMQLPKMVMTSWMHDGLPECIWIAAVSQEVNSRSAAHGPLDVLEPFVPVEETDVLDGRVSRFALIPPEAHAEARAALRKHAPYGLPDGLGHALAQYPECPSIWLYEDWLAENDPVPDRGIDYLTELVKPMIPSRDSYSAELRLMVLARRAKAGKFRMAPDIETAQLLSKYPTYLNADDRARVESFARASWNGLIGITDDGKVAVAEWGQYFWRRSYEISPCSSVESGIGPNELDDENELPEGDDVGVSDAEPSLADFRRAFAEAASHLGDDLRRLQTKADLDTFSSTMDEVKLGLASRAFRLLRNFLLTPHWWSNEMAPHLIRSLIDERIVAAWLLKRNDPELFQAFKDYGAGKRKLYKLKLEELMDEEGPEGREREDVREIHARLEQEVNQDTMEEFLEIDLGGTFSGKNIREMAKEANLADLYSLTYQPLSTESHGEWGSLIMFDLDHCGNPLHLYHRLGSFDTDGHSYIHLGWARTAVDLAEDIVTEIFASIDLDAEPAFVRFHETVAAARKPSSDP